MVTTCEWNDKLIRRAIVWLCQQTGKPILKLTNQDYNDHGLGELLAIYGSGYNVNIKVFNELQHTITGWPGGKPDADDTYRPERLIGHIVVDLLALLLEIVVVESEYRCDVVVEHDVAHHVLVAHCDVARCLVGYNSWA